MKTVHVAAGGGIGDVIYTYFQERSWRLIIGAKESCPELVVLAIVVSHSAYAKELIALHPAIDAILTQRWFEPGHEQERLWEGLVQTSSIEAAAGMGFEEREPIIYLSDEEKEHVELLASEPYIVIHPFAGLSFRGCLANSKGEYFCFPDYKYRECAILLADMGWRVIIIGQSELYGDRRQTEYFLLDSDRIFNLVNKLSLRESVEITRRAVGFLGAHSSMLSAAWTNEVPSVFFYPAEDEHGNKRNVLEYGGTTGTWALGRNYHDYFELRPKQFLDLDVKFVVEKLLWNMRVKEREVKAL